MKDILVITATLNNRDDIVDAVGKMKIGIKLGMLTNGLLDVVAVVGKVYVDAWLFVRVKNASWNGNEIFAWMLLELLSRPNPLSLAPPRMFMRL